MSSPRSPSIAAESRRTQRSAQEEHIAMSTGIQQDDYAQIDGAQSLTIHRLLPGPIERVWEYLTHSQLRRQWLAAGDMQMQVGAPFELVWRNDELSEQPQQRPPEFNEEERMRSRIRELDPPYTLAFDWGQGTVRFDLAPVGDKVMLTITHQRLPDGNVRLNVATGWHTHLDILRTRLHGESVAPFWAAFLARRDEYVKRLHR